MSLSSYNIKRRQEVEGKYDETIKEKQLASSKEIERLEQVFQYAKYIKCFEKLLSKNGLCKDVFISPETGIYSPENLKKYLENHQSPSSNIELSQKPEVPNNQSPTCQYTNQDNGETYDIKIINGQKKYFCTDQDSGEEFEVELETGEKFSLTYKANELEAKPNFLTH